MARRQAPLRMPDVKDSTTIFGPKYGNQGATFPGGLDLLTPNLLLHPGACKDMVNFEVSQNAGYGRIAGYERFSGLPSPSDASFALVQVESFSTVPDVGDAITQAGSGASGTVALVNNVIGAYYMIVTETSGTFNTTGVVSRTESSYTVTSANPLTVTSVNSPFVVPLTSTTIGTAITTTVFLTPAQTAQYQVAAADIYRNDIEAVPGSGAILGVVYMNFSGSARVDGNVYAFRANVAGTAVNIWKSSVTGWVAVPLYNTVAFTAAGTAAPAVGDTLTQGPASATIKQVLISSGTIAGSTAAGTLVVTTPNLGFAAGAATTSGGGTLTLSGAQSPIVILPGGRYEFAKYNFSGQLITRYVYGCDGVNKAFVFDSNEVYSPITTGFSPDTPNHIAAHHQHLFLSKASSVIFSGDGEPFRFLASDGGGEIPTGDIVTGMLTLPGAQTSAALGIWMHTATGILYGTDQETFNFVLLNAGTGANPGSIQNLFDTLSFPDLGIVTLQATLNFGNFNSVSLTKNIQPFINQQNGKITCSTVNRSKSQYRVFFNDGYGLYLTYNNQTYLGSAPIQFPIAVNCIDNDINGSGEEVTFFGASDDDGYVYQLDMGPNFDGEEVLAYFTPAWDYLKSPRILKRYICASIEMQGTAYAAISFGYALGDNTTLITQPISVNYASGFSPAIWDTMVWDNFIWDGQTVIPTYADMTGTALDVQPIIRSGTNYIAAFNVSSIIYQYTVRRRVRGL